MDNWQWLRKWLRKNVSQKWCGQLTIIERMIEKQCPSKMMWTIDNDWENDWETLSVKNYVDYLQWLIKWLRNNVRQKSSGQLTIIEKIIEKQCQSKIMWTIDKKGSGVRNEVWTSSKYW